jgi:hypothetical protein
MQAFPKLYSLDEVAAVTGVNINTLKATVQQDRASAVLLGGTWYMSADDIFNYLVDRDPERARTFAQQEGI